MKNFKNEPNTVQDILELMAKQTHYDKLQLYILESLGKSRNHLYK